MFAFSLHSSRMKLLISIAKLGFQH